jgi:hypothetical protein
VAVHATALAEFMIWNSYEKLAARFWSNVPCDLPATSSS